MDTRVHISLEVSNLEKAVEFYARLFQNEPTKLKSDYANFRLESPQLHLALVHNPKRAAEPASNRHYGIELFANERLAAWLEAAQAGGLETRVEEQTTCCYAVADKFWTRDPDGHEWEFWVRQAEAETMNAEASEPLKQAPAAEKARCCAPGRC